MEEKGTRRRAGRRDTPPDWASLPLPGADTWAEDLSTWRVDQGLRQEDLAAVLGVTRDTIASWEGARRLEPLPETLELLEVLKSRGPDAVKAAAAKIAQRKVTEKFSSRKKPKPKP